MNSDMGADHGLSRRSLLKAAGGLVLAGTAGRALLGTPAYAGEDKSDEGVFDTIVVGAGLAGVTAARELRKKGQRVLLLEARDRIGGRTWTDTFLGQQIERGGTWVDPSQPHVWRELQRYKIPIMADVGPERVVLPTVGGFSEYDATAAYQRQAELFTPFFDAAATIFPRPYEPFHNEQAVIRYDGFSLRDRLDQMRLPPEDEIRLTSTTSLFGGSSKRGALTHLDQWWQLAGGTFEKFHGVNTFRPQTGTGSLVAAILADNSPVLRLNSPVASVVQESAKVKVTTKAGREYQAAEVIMAVPVNVWRHIKFGPTPLPEAYTTASTQTFGVPHEKKLWIDLSEPADRFIAEAPEGVPLCIFGRLNEGQLVVAFSVKDTFDPSSRAQVEAAVRQVLPGAKVGAYTATNWHTEEYSRGVGVFRQPYQLTRLHRKIQQPFGKIKFAGGDIADGWSGYMDGAIESGLKVAGSPTLTGPALSTAALPAVDRKVYRSVWGL